VMSAQSFDAIGHCVGAATAAVDVRRRFRPPAIADRRQDPRYRPRALDVLDPYPHGSRIIHSLNRLGTLATLDRQPLATRCYRTVPTRRSMVWMSGFQMSEP